jgi:hypothetical protein
LNSTRHSASTSGSAINIAFHHLRQLGDIGRNGAVHMD